MTKHEAIQALKEGKKLTHRYFDSHEWIRQEGFTMIMEDGASIDVDTFWKDRNFNNFETDWSIYEESLEDAAKKYYDDNNSKYHSEFEITTHTFKYAVQWQKDRTQSLINSHKELLKLATIFLNDVNGTPNLDYTYNPEYVIEVRKAIETANQLKP